MNKFNPKIHRRRSVRLKDYDYSQAGAYFVTICTQERECLFGEVLNGEMRLSIAGKMICNIWKEMSQRFSNIKLDIFTVMPNHFHGIIFIEGRGEPCVRPKNVGGTQDIGVAKNIFDSKNIVDCPRNQGEHKVRPYGTMPETVGRFIQAYKSITTHQYALGVRNGIYKPFPGKLWQRNYHEHVIRNDQSLKNIREYILNNPLEWDFDPENPFHLKDSNIFGRPNRASIQKEQAFA